VKPNKYFTKQFYRYWFYKIKREKPWDYLFFDWTIFLLLGVIFIVGLLLFFPGKIFINIPEKNTQVYILESILRNISLFIGISFSFILLSFNIFYRYFGRYAFLDFFKNKSAKICLTLLICTIGLLIYSTSYIRDIKEINSFDKFIFYFSLILSIISFFSVFPCLLILLRNSQNRENIKRLFQRLNENWLIDEFQARVIDKSLHRFYHKDPISILNEIGLSAIKEFDNKTVLVITTNCPDFFSTNLKLFASEKSRIDNLTLYDEFTKLLSNLFQLSVKERNETSSMMIMGARFRLEEHVLNNLKTKGFENFTDHEALYRYWRLNFDTGDFFKRAIQFNEDEVCKRIIDKYRDFAVKAIPVLFPKDIKYTKERHYTAAREADMVFEPLRTINDLVSTIITNKKNHLFQPIFTLYYTIEQAVLKLGTTDEVKCFILNIIFNYKYDVFNQYSDLQDVQHISNLNFPFSWPVQTFKDIGCTTPHLGFLQVMSLLFAKNKLNTVVINNLKAEMLHLINLVTERADAKTLILKSINKFKSLASKISQTDSDYRKDTYLKLEKYLRIVFNLAVEKSITDQEIMNDFKSSLDSFNYKNQFETELAGKGYISDDRII
jgi:hypothetical protein